MRTAELKQLLSEHKYIELRIGSKYASTYFVKNEYSLMHQQGNYGFTDEYSSWNSKSLPFNKAVTSMVGRIRYAENVYDKEIGRGWYKPNPLNIYVTVKNEHWVEEKSFTINLRGGE